MLTTVESASHFSPASKEGEHNLPRRKLACSLAVGWTSLLVQTLELSANVEPLETSPTPDQLLVLVTRGDYEVECFSDRSWKSAAYRPGLGGLTAGGKIDRLRWQSKTSKAIEILTIYIPQFFLFAAADEYRRAGTPLRVEQPNVLRFCDPVVSQVGLSLMEAVKVGAPNLYAESAAQFLATHLLSPHSRWSEPSTGTRSPGFLSHRRLQRVLEFMDGHYGEALSLDRLAKEAGVSRFYFVRLFRESFGVTPHRHLVRLRMSAAARMLGSTELGVQEIASRCGYTSANHFSAAFQKHFLRTPSGYRTKIYAAEPDR